MASAAASARARLSSAALGSPQHPRQVEPQQRHPEPRRRHLGRERLAAALHPDAAARRAAAGSPKRRASGAKARARSSSQALKALEAAQVLGRLGGLDQLEPQVAREQRFFSVQDGAAAGARASGRRWQRAR